MFKQSQPENIKKIGKIDTLISADTEFKGTISTKGTIRIDGILEGAISNAEGVIVGENGTIKGNISGQTIIVGGKVIGNIEGAQGVEIHNTAHIEGDIATALLGISEGAFFEGGCTMKRSPEKLIEPEFKKSAKHQND